MANAAQDPKRKPDQEQDHPDRPEQLNRQYEADDQQHNAEYDHAESSGETASRLGDCPASAGPRPRLNPLAVAGPHSYASGVRPN